MDLLFILRDASASSLVSTALLAMHAKGKGSEVAILVTQEALAAMARGLFAWPRELSGQEMRLTIADRAKAQNLPLLGRGEGRQLDVKALIGKAREAGVVFYACPTWTSLLGLEGKVPEGMKTPSADEVLDMIRDAKKVVGTL
jgi:peroxiredoxin family protein